jgi:pimeloyl-ACP methyl ester carboxylesterase
MIGMPFFEAGDGTRLFYTDWGTGKPVLFINGWTLNTTMWEYQTAFLVEQGLRCVTYDRRGHGRSDQPGDGYDYDTLAGDLAALIERLDLRDLMLVAHSAGSGELARYLSRHSQDRIARAVFVAAVTPFLLRTEDNPDGLDGGIFDAVEADLRADRIRWLLDGGPAYFGVESPSFWSASTETMLWTLRQMLETPLKVMIDLFRAYTTTDFRPDIRAIAVPSLVIHGDADASAPLPLTGVRTAASISGSRLIV